MSCADKPFEIRAGDTAPIFEADASTCRGAFDFTGWTLTFKMSGPAEVSGAATGSSTGLVSYAWQAGDTAIPGTYAARIVGIGPSGETQTFPTAGDVTIEIFE